MKITSSQRRALLIAIALALAAVAIYDNEDDSRGAVSAAPAPRAALPRGKIAQAPLPEIAFDKLDQKIARDPVGDAFEPRSWEPPPPPQKAPPPPPPQAPPLPYTYVGKIMEGNQEIVY